jgi:hypothetical protein
MKHRILWLKYGWSAGEQAITLRLGYVAITITCLLSLYLLQRRRATAAAAACTVCTVWRTTVVAPMLLL